MHHKNEQVSAVRTSEFFCALQQVNNNHLYSLSMVSCFYFIHTEIFSYFNSEIGMKDMDNSTSQFDSQYV